jgi:putative colanic acid biosynthesis acetyltransferase WcaF
MPSRLRETFQTRESAPEAALPEGTTEIKPMAVDLSTFDNSWYSPGRPYWVRCLWFFVGLPVLRNAWLPSSALRRRLLKLFGARVGRHVVIKPGVRVKYPWLLAIGDNSWIGEDVWIDNLAQVRIGSNVCISQSAYICTGNHDWTDPAFGLLVGPVTIRSGAWIGARALLCPGAEVLECAIAAAGSVVTGRLDAYTIYAGNPAIAVRTRQVVTARPARIPKRRADSTSEAGPTERHESIIEDLRDV